MGKKLIVCEELAKLYASLDVRVLALQGTDLVIREGELVAIIGESGSGKSTLLNLIGGLEQPSAGKLFVDGKEISSYTEKEMVEYRNRMVGFVWQNCARNLLPYLTVRQNVEAPMLLSGRFSGKERKERVCWLLSEVGMENYMDRLPGQLSGGQQQRAAIAVALSNAPKILLADEPTGAVDVKTSDQILSLFRSLNESQGLTVLMVTHDLRMAEQVGRTIRISHGRIL